jgi:hypothetical protein
MIIVRFDPELAPDERSRLAQLVPRGPVTDPELGSDLPVGQAVAVTEHPHLGELRRKCGLDQTLEGVADRLAGYRVLGAARVDGIEQEIIAIGTGGLFVA